MERRTWQRPTLPGGCPPSTIGAGGLNCRVRDGTGCTPAAYVTKKSSAAFTCLCADPRSPGVPTPFRVRHTDQRRAKKKRLLFLTGNAMSRARGAPSSPPHSREWRSPRPLVWLSSPLARLTPATYRARRLRAVLLVFTTREFILGRVSYLDAFSSSHSRRWLPSRALGRTTRTPALRPPRSSRTRGSLPQLPCAHSG